MTREVRLDRAPASPKSAPTRRPIEVATQRWNDLKSAFHGARAHDGVDADGHLEPVLREFSQLQSALEACERLKEEGRLREKWIAVLAHDLRTPVLAIQGAARRLSSSPLDDAERLLVQRIERRAARLGALVGETLDFAHVRFGADGIVIRPRWCSLRSLCEEAIDEVHAAHPERTIELRALSNEDGMWDPHRVTQLLVHLVSNAVFYAAPSTAVTVTLTPCARGVEIAVHNLGDAIDEERLPKLFEPFQRGDNVGANELGLGLGLFMARAITVAQGGEIDATSSARDGTTFRVRLDRGSQPAASSTD